LGALTAYGFIFKNEKIRTTTLLASQAYITGTLIESTIKFLAGRTRPSYYDPAGVARPRFLGPFGNTSRDFNGSRSNSSFPSGHATVAFAAATVFAMEYKNTLWVPIFSYSAATLIALSRITENKHWTTDVFVGSVLGYLSGRNIVNNYHRYAKLKAPNIPKNTVTFDMRYNEFHQVAPALVYHIR
jgi:membrane-associated phospholipid phosphatase